MGYNASWLILAVISVIVDAQVLLYVRNRGDSCEQMIWGVRKENVELKEENDVLKRQADDYKRELMKIRCRSDAVDCQWYKKKEANSKNGVYNLSVCDDNLVFREFEAFCDMDRDGGGWTVIFSRDEKYSYNGNRSWAEYRDGFGDVDKNYWLGDKMNDVSGMRFSTYDTDNDLDDTTNYAAEQGGGWWYKKRSYVKLTTRPHQWDYTDLVKSAIMVRYVL